MRAIRAGHLYTAVDGVATPASFEFTATNEHGTVNEGDELGVGGPVTLRVRSNAPSAFTTIIWKGNSVVSADHHEQDGHGAGAGRGRRVYWAEIRATGRPTAVTWVRSNPIYVRSRAGRRAATRALARRRQSLAIFDGDGERVACRARSRRRWRRSEPRRHRRRRRTAVPLRAGGRRIGRARWRRWPSTRRDGVAAYDRLTFSIRAEHPMRISVQLRAGDDQGPASRERWKRTVYVDASAQERTVFFDDLTPVGETHAVRRRRRRHPHDSVRGRRHQHEAGRLGRGSGSGKRALGKQVRVDGSAPGRPSAADRRPRRRRGCSAPTRRASARSSRPRPARRRCSASSSRRAPGRCPTPTP